MAQRKVLLDKFGFRSDIQQIRVLRICLRITPINAIQVEADSIPILIRWESSTKIDTLKSFFLNLPMSLILLKDWNKQYIRHIKFSYLKKFSYHISFHEVKVNKEIVLFNRKYVYENSSWFWCVCINFVI